jgi:peptidoglycan/xylan/chitin deacetylase (PgdA/CDA1 family)
VPPGDTAGAAGPAPDELPAHLASPDGLPEPAATGSGGESSGGESSGGESSGGESSGGEQVGCPAAGGGAVTQAPGGGRTVALTFDDGPGDDTAALLGVLAQRGVRATFFVIGASARAHPELVARAAAGGNLIGDHSWRHAYPRQVRGGWTRSYLLSDLTRTNQVISDADGQPVCWFRPPGGFLPPTVLPMAQALGMRVALWSVDPRDWQLQGAQAKPLRQAQITDTIVRRVSAGLAQQHPIILLHDGGGSRRASVAAVSRIIDLYQAHGYRFVRLDGTGH